MARKRDRLMVLGAIKRALGGEYNEKEIKKISPIIDEVNSFEPEISPLSDEELAARITQDRGSTIEKARAIKKLETAAAKQLIKAQPKPKAKNDNV
ncbi:MAG: hypothetical protein IH920_02555 [Chloroflexi bacterium]|nr:hypothetical protein [Chloroflexota bacterium]